MKYFFGILTSVIFLFYSTINMKEDPNVTGKEVFSILQKFENKEQFIDGFLSFEEIQIMSKNEKLLGEKTKKQMASTPEKMWNKRIESFYTQLTEKNKEFEINWNEIKFLDFKPTVWTEDKLKGAKGKLRFESNNHNFIIETMAIYNGEKYKLTEIKNLQKE